MYKKINEIQNVIDRCIIFYLGLVIITLTLDTLDLLTVFKITYTTSILLVIANIFIATKFVVNIQIAVFNLLRDRLYAWHK